MAEESQEPNFYPKYRKVLPPGLGVNQVNLSFSLHLNCKKTRRVCWDKFTISFKNYRAGYRQDLYGVTTSPYTS